MATLSITGLLFAFGAALSFAVYGLLSRVIAKDNADPLTLSVVFGLYCTVFSLPIFFFEPWKFGQINIFVLLITFLATLFYALFQGSEFFARKHMEASRMTVLFQLTPVVTFIGALLFLNESFSTTKLIAIVLIFLGNLVACYKHGGHVTNRGLFFGIVTAIFLGLGYVADKFVFELYPLGLYIAITYFFPSLYILPFVKNKKISIKNAIISGSWRLPLLGVIGVIGYFFVLKTFFFLEASVAIPITYTSTILTGLGGIIILKEKSSIPQKIAGAVLVFIGIILLN